MSILTNESGRLRECLGASPTNESVVGFVQNLCQLDPKSVLALKPGACGSQVSPDDDGEVTAKSLAEDRSVALKHMYYDFQVLHAQDPESDVATFRIIDKFFNLIDFDIEINNPPAQVTDGLGTKPSITLDTASKNFGKELFDFIKARFQHKKTKQSSIKERVIHVSNVDDRPDVKVGKLTFKAQTETICPDLADLLKVQWTENRPNLITKSSELEYLVRIKASAKPYKMSIQQENGEFVLIVTPLNDASQPEEGLASVKYTVVKSRRPGNKPPRPRLSEILYSKIFQDSKK